MQFAADQVVWQKYNPYPKIQAFPDLFVFVDSGEGCQGAFQPRRHHQRPAAAIAPALPRRHRQAEPVRPEFRAPGANRRKHRQRLLERHHDAERRRGASCISEPTHPDYVLAAHIFGKASNAVTSRGEKRQGRRQGRQLPRSTWSWRPTSTCSVRCSSNWREQGDVPELGIHFEFDNVTFVLNALDALAGDNRFIAIRSRRPKHRTLTQIENRTEASRLEATQKRQEYCQGLRTEGSRGRGSAQQEIGGIEEPEGAQFVHRRYQRDGHCHA